jgi:hypothetical protein
VENVQVPMIGGTAIIQAKVMSQYSVADVGCLTWRKEEDRSRAIVQQALYRGKVC